VSVSEKRNIQPAHRPDADMDVFCRSNVFRVRNVPSFKVALEHASEGRLAAEVRDHGRNEVSVKLRDPETRDRESSDASSEPAFGEVVPLTIREVVAEHLDASAVAVFVGLGHSFDLKYHGTVEEVRPDASVERTYLWNIYALEAGQFRFD
jgi:hypothetical protein